LEWGVASLEGSSLKVDIGVLLAGFVLAIWRGDPEISAAGVKDDLESLSADIDGTKVSHVVTLVLEGYVRTVTAARRASPLITLVRFFGTLLESGVTRAELYESTADVAFTEFLGREVLWWLGTGEENARDAGSRR